MTEADGGAESRATANYSERPEALEADLDCGPGSVKLHHRMGGDAAPYQLL
jgi:hypothetical protein